MCFVSRVENDHDAARQLPTRSRRVNRHRWGVAVVAFAFVASIMATRTGEHDHGVSWVEAPPAADNGGVAPWAPELSAPGQDELAPMCTGTGSDGPRVTLAYLYNPAVNDRSALFLPALRSAAGNIDRLMMVSSAAQSHPSARRVRWQTDAGSAGCQVKVTAIKVSEPVVNGRDNQGYVNALRSAGLGPRADRSPLFVIAVADSSTWKRRYCGITTNRQDDSRTGFYRNPGYGYTDISPFCLQYEVMLHELAHYMGAVMRTAKNSTLGAHCNDGTDIMCYTDSGARRTQRSVCPATAYHRFGLLDCNADDYFSTNPAPGSYLATRWNVADSPVLYRVDTPAGAFPAIRSTSVASPLIPYVPTPFTMSVTTASGVAFGADKDGVRPLSGYQSTCHASVEPTRTSGTVTVTGQVACGDSITRVNQMPSSVPMVLADRDARDLAFQLPVRVASPARILDATIAVEHLPGRTGVRFSVTGALPGGARTPLWGVRLYVTGRTGAALGSWVVTGPDGIAVVPVPTAPGSTYTVRAEVAPGTWNIPRVTFKTPR